MKISSLLLPVVCQAWTTVYRRVSPSPQDPAVDSWARSKSCTGKYTANAHFVFRIALFRLAYELMCYLAKPNRSQAKFANPNPQPREVTGLIISVRQSSPKSVFIL